VTYSGLTPDFKSLLLKARKDFQKHNALYKVPMTGVQLARELAQVMQEYTISGIINIGGVRPFGVSLLLASYDNDGPHLYQIDPSGSYFGCKATAIGKNYQNMKNFLEKRYVENLSIEDAIHISILTLKETYDTEMNEKNISIGIASKDGTFRVY